MLFLSSLSITTLCLALDPKDFLLLLLFFFFFFFFFSFMILHFKFKFMLLLSFWVGYEIYVMILVFFCLFLFCFFPPVCGCLIGPALFCWKDSLSSIQLLCTFVKNHGAYLCRSFSEFSFPSHWAIVYTSAGISLDSYRYEFWNWMVWFLSLYSFSKLS